MRANIKDIMKLAKCDEMEAENIESKINDSGVLNWSECSISDIEFEIELIMVEL